MAHIALETIYYPSTEHDDYVNPGLMEESLAKLNINNYMIAFRVYKDYNSRLNSALILCRKGNINFNNHKHTAR